MRSHAILATLICLSATVRAEGKDGIRDSVVKIYSLKIWQHGK